MSSVIQESATGPLSTTICISDPRCQWPLVQASLVEYLSTFGDIARVDTSLNLVLRCILVTYYDVRNAQRAMAEMGGRAESFPPAPHDCRTVLVSLSFDDLNTKMQIFSEFGEVANVTTDQTSAIVEYFDMRAAQYLLSALGPKAQPYVKTSQAPANNALTTALANLTMGGLGGFAGCPPVPGFPPAPPAPPSPPAAGGQNRPVPLTALAKAALDAEVNGYAGKPDVGKGVAFGQDKAAADRAGNRPVRTKVTTKEFSKYDIEPEKIQRGLDHRTTVMVRNLTGQHARRDFLNFLEKCGLHDRYTFFYMPCKEHRNVHAGFAFVNFLAPKDVHKLFLALSGSTWRQCSSDPSAKVPAVSYARFQGHDELVSHFSSSAVMHEQDPDKRPIFRNGADTNSGSGGDSTDSKEAKCYYQGGGTGGTPGSPKAKKFTPKSKGDTVLKEALDKGANEIVALLKKGMMKPGEASCPESGATMPAYIDVPCMPPPKEHYDAHGTTTPMGSATWMAA